MKGILSFWQKSIEVEDSMGFKIEWAQGHKYGMFSFTGKLKRFILWVRI